jgi:hypothetical protein
MPAPTDLGRSSPLATADFRWAMGHYPVRQDSAFAWFGEIPGVGPSTEPGQLRLTAVFTRNDPGGMSWPSAAPAIQRCRRTAWLW